MNTLKTLIITTTLACFTQVAHADNDASNGNMTDNYGMDASVGYWRTYEDEQESMNAYQDETLANCLDRCKANSFCNGAEYRISTSNQGYAQNTCEVHFDPFMECEVSSNMSGQSLSTCWVKDQDNDDISITPEEEEVDSSDSSLEVPDSENTNSANTDIAGVNNNSDGFSIARQRLEAQLAAEDYTPSQVRDLINEHTPEINELRSYLTASCLSSSDTSGSSSYGGGPYVGSTTQSYLELHADGTYRLSSYSAVYTGGGYSSTDQTESAGTGYWNVFQGSNGNMILVVSPDSGGVSLSFIPSYDYGAIGVIPFTTNTRETWRRTPDSTCY